MKAMGHNFPMHSEYGCHWWAHLASPAFEYKQHKGRGWRGGSNAEVHEESQRGQRA